MDAPFESVRWCERGPQKRRLENDAASRRVAAWRCASSNACARTVPTTQIGTWTANTSAYTCWLKAQMLRPGWFGGAVTFSRWLSARYFILSSFLVSVGRWTHAWAAFTDAFEAFGHHRDRFLTSRTGLRCALEEGVVSTGLPWSPLVDRLPNWRPVNFFVFEITFEHPPPAAPPPPPPPP